MTGYLFFVGAAVCGFMFNRMFWVGWEMARRVVVSQAYHKHYQELFGIQPVRSPALPGFCKVLYGVLKFPPHYFRQFDTEIQEFYHDHQRDFVRMFSEESDAQESGHGA